MSIVRGAICLMFLAASITPIAAKDAVSAGQLVDEFMQLRMELTREEDRSVIMRRIDDFESTLALYKLTAAERLVLDNFIVMERYNYMRSAGEEARQVIRAALKELRERNVKTLEDEGDNASKWLLCTAGDVTSCYISFSIADVIKYGLGIKKLYQRAVEKDALFSYGLTNIAQWYYWAPKINGGSKKKAAECFEKAVRAARTNAEKFYAETFWSQWLFESGDENGALRALERAEKLCAGSKRISEMRQANKEGVSFFEWDRKHSRMEGKGRAS